MLGMCENLELFQRFNMTDPIYDPKLPKFNLLLLFQTYKTKYLMKVFYGKMYYQNIQILSRLLIIYIFAKVDLISGTNEAKRRIKNKITNFKKSSSNFISLEY